jgi:hypothetical protein
MQRAVERRRREPPRLPEDHGWLAGEPPASRPFPDAAGPDHKILPYSAEVPEDIIVGKPLFYATSFSRPDGGAEGLLVETHPRGATDQDRRQSASPGTTNGKASTWAIASIMSLYDPDRLKFPLFAKSGEGRLEATWRRLPRPGPADHFKQHAGGGEGLAFVVGKGSSPSLEAAKAYGQCGRSRRRHGRGTPRPSSPPPSRAARLRLRQAPPARRFASTRAR